MSKLIRITCEGAAVMPLDQIVELQGNLKELSVVGYDKLKALIETEGFAFPLSIARINGKPYGVIDGHQRHRTVRKMVEEGYAITGLDGAASPGNALPVSWIDCRDRKQAGRLILAAVSQFGKVTDEGLYAFLDDFEIDMATLDTLDLPDFDVEKFADGYGPEKADADAEPQIDHAEELNKKWKVKPGDLWRIGEHRLLCGDSTKADDVARVMGGESCAVVSDPPYGISVDTSWLSALNVKRGKPPCKSDDRLQGDDGTLDLSWVYRQPEWIVFGFPYVARSENYTGLLVWDKRGDGGENGLGNPIEVAASNAFNGYRLSRHVWAGYVRESGEKREAHPTQKPVGIMADAIELVSSTKVLDPFLGSGTTMVAAQNLSRKCYGIEISPAYCAVILERMATAFPGIKIERVDGQKRSGTGPKRPAIMAVCGQ